MSSIREDGQVYFKGGKAQAPARYLKKHTTPQGIGRLDERKD